VIERPQVLVVEDDEGSLELVSVLLERMSYRVTAARSAEEAVEVLRAARPSAVIVDIRLPGQDGLSLTRRLKAAPATASIPVLALTAHARPADREAALQAGCAAWMTKPLDARLLARTLDEVLRSPAPQA
jgi:CheY-like chemotaxis protein